MESPDLLLHLVAVADLAPSGPPRLHPVDRDGLEGLLESLAPRAGALTFRSFKDFRPERLAQAHPPAAALLKLRAQALDVAAGRGSAEDLRRALSPALARSLDEALTKPRKPAPSGGVFDLVDVEATSSGLDALIGELVGPGAAAPPAALRAVAAKIEAALGDVLRAELAKLRELESAWRGLRWLVRSVDFRAGCRMSVLPCGKAERAGAIRDVLLPFAAELRARGSVPFFVFDAELEEEVAGVPAVAGWSGSPAPRGVTAAANRIRLRPSYGEAGDRVKDFAFEEGGEPLLGRASWVVGALAANAFARSGWAADFAGAAAAESLEPLPMVGETPLERELRESEARALGDQGVVALVGRPGSDRPFAATGAGLRLSLFGAQVGVHLERLLSRLDPGAEMESVAKTLAAGLELLAYPALSVTARAVEDGRPAVAMTIRPVGGPLRGLPALEVEIPVPRF
jgi:hypothetical protein